MPAPDSTTLRAGAPLLTFTGLSQELHTAAPGLPRLLGEYNDTPSRSAPSLCALLPTALTLCSVLCRLPSCCQNSRRSSATERVLIPHKHSKIEVVGSAGSNEHYFWQGKTSTSFGSSLTERTKALQGPRQGKKSILWSDECVSSCEPLRRIRCFV